MEDIVIHNISGNEAEKLTNQNNKAVEQAQKINIFDDNTYVSATEFLKGVKSGIKTVENTFEDMKKQANKAHKSICDTENSFKKPLQEAERIVKSKMQGYLAEQEKIRRENEERLRLERQKLADEQLAKAAQLESAGKKEEAQSVLHTATVISSIESPVKENIKVSGISTQQDFEIFIADGDSVPVYFNGILLRPIDESAVKKLVKLANGKIKIPGVEITSKEIIKVKI